MCGIAGMFGERVDADLVVRMRDTLAHRGPDGAGLFAAPDVVLGHRRLSIIDLSDNGHQPMSTKDGRYTITFNGEIYNYKEIRAELEQKYTWVSQSDTEVILHAYEEWGESAVQRFNGMFAFAIYDAREHTLWCVRDRLGIKPFYYAFENRRFVFGSEIKAVLASGLRAKEYAPRIFDYLALGLYDHTQETFFEGIHKLPPGHWFKMKVGQMPRPVRYWSLADRVSHVDVPSTDRECIEQFSALFQDAIRLRLRSDVPVGVTLSSGLDSTSLLAHLRKALPASASLHAFTACFHEQAFDEGRPTEEVIRLFDHPWHKSYLTPEEVPGLSEQMLHFQDEPYGGIPQLSFFKLHQLAREQGVTVLLEGHGVEEYLTGYPLYFPPYWTDLFKQGHWLTLGRELRGFSKAGRGSARRIWSDWSSFLSHRQGMHLDLTKQSFSSLVSAEYAKASAEPVRQERPFSTHLENVLYWNMTAAKLPRVLRFQDRVSMAMGRELRLPFLDYRLVEFVYALASRYKIRSGVDKWILRKSVEGLVPQEKIYAKKSYVVTPQTAWFKRELRPFMESMIQSESFKSRACFNQVAVQQAVKRFEADPAPKNSFFLWQLMNLEAWFRKYIDV